MRIGEWHVYAHPLFLEQCERLIAAAQRERAKAPHIPGPNAKLLAALRKLVFEVIPSDPTRPEYRQGDTLGTARKHWFRAKFGGGRFRLFFRFDTRAKIIIVAWVNDSETKRTYGAKSDAYAVFRRMLEGGNPPDDWVALLAAASDPLATSRLKEASDR
jgi:toxin YhaV